MDAPKRIQKVDARITRTGYGGALPLAMGLVFTAVGTALALSSLGVLPQPGKANAPMWVLTAVGVAFASAGLLLTVYALRGVLARRRRAALEVRHPGRPWHYDYPWTPEGVEDGDAGGPLAWLTGLLGLVVLASLLTPFNWLAFGGPWDFLAAQIGVGLFDLVLVAAVLTSIYRALRRAKYGHHRLAFARFPFAPGERVEVALSPNDGLALEATLRFVEERFEVSGSGRHRSQVLRAYEHWSERRSIAASPGAGEIPIEFDLPGREDWVTQLTADPGVRYWELLVEAEAPGVDLRTTFPLPVYRCTRADVVRARRAPPLRRRAGWIGPELGLPLALAALLAGGWLVAPDLYRAGGELALGWWHGRSAARALEPVEGVSSAGLTVVRGADGAIYGLTKYEVIRARGEEVETLLAARAAPAGFGRMNALSALAPGRGGGELWVGSWYGELYRFAGGAWSRVLERGAPLARRIHALAVRPAGVYIAGSDGLWRRDPAGGMARVEGVPEGPAQALAEAPDGTLVAAVVREVWRIAPGERIRLGILPETITALAPGAGGGWLAGTRRGLYRLDPGGAVSGPAIAARRIAALGISAGRVWAGTIDSGLWWRQQAGWRVADRASGLPGAHVLGAALDDAGRLWLAIYGGGLSRVPVEVLGEAMRSGR